MGWGGVGRVRGRVRGSERHREADRCWRSFGGHLGFRNSPAWTCSPSPPRSPAARRRWRGTGAAPSPRRGSSCRPCTAGREFRGTGGGSAVAHRPPSSGDAAGQASPSRLEGATHARGLRKSSCGIRVRSLGDPARSGYHASSAVGRGVRGAGLVTVLA